MELAKLIHINLGTTADPRNTTAIILYPIYRLESESQSRDERTTLVGASCIIECLRLWCISHVHVSRETHTHALDRIFSVVLILLRNPILQSKTMTDSIYEVSPLQEMMHFTIMYIECRNGVCVAARADTSHTRSNPSLKASAPSVTETVLMSLYISRTLRTSTRHLILSMRKRWREGVTGFIEGRE